MKSLADVARLAGVSKATASRALSGTGYVSERTRLLVTQAALDLGYVASTNAASLVTGRTRNIGVVSPYINRWFFAEVIDGVEEALLEDGYDLTLYRLRGDADQRARVFDYFLVRKRVDAVIAVGMDFASDDVGPLFSLRKPVVGVGSQLPGATTVGIDDIAASRLITRHLIDLGHRRILHLGGPIDGTATAVHSRRREGFRLEMASAGLSEGADVAPCEMTTAEAYTAVLEFLERAETLPTAIAAASDEVAVGAILAARTRGLTVPEDLSVIAIDDHPLSALFDLTTVAQAPSKQGRAAARLVLGILAGATPTAPGLIAAPLEITYRGSTAAPSSTSR
ncbi:LacI family DNA-binding transcriptional regulator [Amnibacterium flavum]|uniref:LacI family transcriptional regulator n=1 Tax=Amnibacterium flavum TaxID=2173173 RepID=A0A2V1HSY5_9MICO|nr:LacI family DNA-binding transcriptional regulator [Amnibacterium flavum]PVZ95693.1 LacI family transcriptional regulator [Amnibacterium flavum]